MHSHDISETLNLLDTSISKVADLFTTNNETLKHILTSISSSLLIKQSFISVNSISGCLQENMFRVTLALLTLLFPILKIKSTITLVTHSITL